MMGSDSTKRNGLARILDGSKKFLGIEYAVISVVMLDFDSKVASAMCSNARLAAMASAALMVSCGWT